MEPSTQSGQLFEEAVKSVGLRTGHGYALYESLGEQGNFYRLLSW